MRTILSLFPNTNGFGYACVGYPQKLLDFGVVTSRSLVNSTLQDRVEKLIEFNKPQVVVIRDCRAKGAKAGKQALELEQSITRFAINHKIPVYVYSRQQIRDVFEISGASTKFEIAQKIAESFPELASRVPKVRKIHKPEDHGMGFFDAIALAFTHHYLSE
jgi:Holliday junction resolvasome RuvABC endonuclease subunit